MKIYIFLCLTLSVLLSLCVLPNCQAKETIATTSPTSATTSGGSTSITSNIDNAKVTGSTAAISNAEPTELKLVSIKPKRDAALSLGGGGGGGGGGYHGPSHKYLPPTTLSSIQYQYQPHHHHQGNAVSSTSGFDYRNLDESNYHHHHHQHHHDDHHHYQDQHQQHYAQAYITPVYQPNKFETYIVQSEHGSSSGPHGYKYVAPALSHHHHHVTEKPHKSYILSSVDHYQHQPQISYGTYVHNKPLSSHGHSHSGHSSSSNSGYHYAPVVEHIEHVDNDHDHDHDHHHHHHQLTHHQSQQHVVPVTNSLSPYLSGTIQGHAGLGGINAGIGFSAGLGGNGYQYDIPHSPYQTIARKPQVLTSYGLPVAVAAEADEPRHQHHQQHQVHQTIATANTKHHHEHNDDDDDVGTPAYAVGHKGLGHFSYISSKPHVTLHNDISEVGVAPHQALIEEQQQHYDTHTLAEISKAPFKPSAFLGAKHELSSGDGISSGVGGDISIYETSAAAAAQQYLPPTSLGYEYQPPTVLYGAPTHSGDSAAPIYEPVEATYLPPSATSAAAGAAATTTGNYLPPTQH